MCDTTETNWEQVLVDWVNCLKLYKPIQNLEELRDGAFFRHLRKVFKKSTDPIPDDDLTIIFDILSRHYPKVTFQEMESVHINDLPPSDLVHLTSLLMHYTCIYDRRNVLTSPMCYNLSSTAQLHIKSFLEKVNSETTTEELADIIKNISSEKKKALSCKLIPIMNSPLVKKSPLQELLKTPASKHLKLQEKDREIDKLRRELEIEKFEKADFEAELKEHHEKVKKLVTQLNQKNSEIKRLRSEVESLEMRTPPHFQDVDSREIQKLLRIEIESLEQYVQQCDKEQEELRKDRDAAKERIRKLETDCKMWQEKFFEVEENFQFFTEHSKELEAKNETLKAHCIELENLLDEYRCKSSNSLDESMQVGNYPNRRSKSFEPLQSAEDLAHSVVDVQLREVQKRLEEVLGDLGCALEDKVRLEEDLVVFKESAANLQESLEQAQIELVETRRKLDEVACDNRRLVHKLSEVAKETSERVRLEEEQKTVELNNKLAKANEEKEGLKSELFEIELRLTNVLAEKVLFKKDMTDKLQNASEELEKTNALLQNTLEELQSVKEEKECLEDVKWDLTRTQESLHEALAANIEMKNKLNEASENLEETVSKLKGATLEKEEALKKLEEMESSLCVVCAEKVELALKLEEAFRELTETKIGLKEASSSKMRLEETLEDTSKELGMIREDLVHVTLEREAASKQLQETQTELMKTKQLLENSSKDLETTRKLLKEKIEELNVMKLEHESVNFYLEDTSKQLEEAEEKLLESEKNLKQNDKIRDNLEKKLEETQRLLVNTREELERVSSEKNAINQATAQLEIALKELEEAKNSLLNTCAETEEKFRKISAEKVELQEAKIRVENDLKNAILNKEELFKSQLKEKEELLNGNKEQLAQMQETKNRLENELLKKEEIKKNSDDRLVALQRSLHNVASDLKKAVAEKEDIENKFVESLERLNEKSGRVEEVLREKRDLEERLSISEASLAELRLKYEELGTALAENQLTILHLKNTSSCLQEAQFENDIIMSNFEALKEENSLLKANLEELEKQIADLYSKIGKILMKFAAITGEPRTTNEILDMIVDFKNEHNEMYSKLESAVAKLQVAEEECAKNNKEVEELKAQLVDRDNEVRKTSAFAEGERRHFSNLLEQVTSKLEQSDSEKRSSLQALDVAQRELRQISCDNTKLERQVKELLENLQNVNEEKCLLIKSLDETVDKLEASEGALKDLKAELGKLQEEKTLISNFLDLNRDELAKVSQEKDQLLEALEMSNKDKLDLEEDNKELNLKLDLLRTSEFNLSQQLYEEHKDYEDVSTKLHETLINLEQLQTKYDTINSDHAKIIEENKKLLKDKTEILENLQKLIKDKEELFGELNNVSSHLEKVKKENDAILSDYKDLQNGHKDNESEIKKLLLENRELTEHLDALKKDKEDIFVNFEEVQKQQKDLENEYKKLLIEKDDIAKEKNDIYDFLQRSVEEKEKVVIERDRLQSENALLIKERDTMYDKLQNLAEEKQKILLSLELSQKETQKVKKERNDILQSQTEIMKETESNIVRAHEVAVGEKKELLKRLEHAEKERDKVREAYANVVGTNSKYELENVTLRKIIEERNLEIQQMANIKEAYEKLLEDSNKYMNEIDTLKYKRSKDREEFVTLLKKERDEAETRKIKKIKEVRAEYEEKLEKMKDKMLKLYREEVNKEMQKVKNEQGEVAYLQKTINDLRIELFEAEKKIQKLQNDKDTIASRNRYVSRESLQTAPLERNPPRQGISSLRGRGNKVADRDSMRSNSSSALSGRERESLARGQQQMKKVNSVSSLNVRECLDKTVIDRRLSTLPSRLQSGDFIEETITVSRRTSINSLGHNLEMEDEEDDMFNNKYLADLKEGRCVANAGRESNVGRISELAWRNSMVPPHLKSSYPAEMQFVSPTKYKEDEIKTGNIELDDSMCRLLPGEKPRQKKDFGTTSYKKPGPPTPSKNGGRLSLEARPLKEVNAAVSSTPKRTTPNRIKALFKGFKDGNSGHDNAENVTPRAPKRLSIFKNRK